MTARDHKVLGLRPGADADAIRQARRRLAKAAHPDAGGSPEAMRRINEAADALLAALAGGVAQPVGPAAAPPPPPAEGEQRPRAATGQRVDHDVASFTIEALPVEAFEALLVVASWLGETIADEPPYQLDVVLGEPLRCWCRLDLVPDAGASTVALTIAALPDDTLVDIDAVRDAWVVALNNL